MERRNGMRDITILPTLALLLGPACSGGGDESAEGTSPTVNEAPKAGAGTGPAANPSGSSSPKSAGTSSDAPPRLDLISYAQGATLVSISFSGAEKGPSRYQAFQSYDGHRTPRALLSGADPTGQLEFVYEMPSLTTFDRLAVPDVTEVPSAYVTFFREIEVSGSASSPKGGFEPLASATLETHKKRGLETDLPLTAKKPVRFVKLVLRGGIQDGADKMGYQFSELIGNGTQDTVPFEDGFTGIWNTKLPDVDRSSGMIELKQDGVSVTGCHVSTTISGTVSGNILRAQGVTTSGTPTQYVLLLDRERALRGAANSNNGPFNMFGGPPAPSGTITKCSDIPQPELGCGSTVYVQFEYDSAKLRPESDPVLSDLFEGLRSSGGATIEIEGHTSSEGSEEYNLNLSKRRAQSVVDNLVRRGLDGNQISAVGRGEAEPIASNKDEAGRSLNRRVSVTCR